MFLLFVPLVLLAGCSNNSSSVGPSASTPQISPGGPTNTVGGDSIKRRARTPRRMTREPDIASAPMFEATRIDRRVIVGAGAMLRNVTLTRCRGSQQPPKKRDAGLCHDRHQGRSVVGSARRCDRPLTVSQPAGGRKSCHGADQSNGDPRVVWNAPKPIRLISPRLIESPKF